MLLKCGEHTVRLRNNDLVRWDGEHYTLITQKYAENGLHFPYTIPNKKAKHMIRSGILAKHKYDSLNRYIIYRISLPKEVHL